MLCFVSGLQTEKNVRCFVSELQSSRVEPKPMHEQAVETLPSAFHFQMFA